MNGTGIRNLFFLLFAISGFSGLIYESIWSHYLKLFLGHAGYAQSLVIAVFMGGMAIGSWIASKYSVRWRNLLLGYAAVEGAIGILGLFFHDTFVQITEVAHYHVLPEIDSVLFARALKWTVAVLLILPQSILLGMSFPLMSAGLIRRYPQTPGASLAMLYFTNSVGAAIGVLASSFLLIKSVGLPGTILTAALVNILLAIVVWLLARDRPSASEATEAPKHHRTSARNWYKVLLSVALLTGTASFIYEIAWIRMLSLVLGSSTHAFELMLSAFIFGLAFGGLWIRRRLDQLGDTVRFLAFVQIIMGLLAMSTLLVYGHTFEFMQWILGILSKTEAAYVVFNLLSHLIALVIMLPATFCAGMTLPLITYALLRQGHGEKSIGRVYAANTAGGILGVLAALHLGMPLLGLKNVIVVGASIDIVLGLALLWGGLRSQSSRVPAISTMVGAGAVIAALGWVELDTHKMASGVYRFGKLLSAASAEIVYHKDGKTATVDLVRHHGTMSIRTNGKPDAHIAIAHDIPPTADEPTAIMAGAVALAAHPGAKTVANIGLGSALTTHVLLTAPWLERVDTVEIERAIVEAAGGFRPRVDAAFADSRSHIYIEDAKTYFATHNAKYDIIVSEPSNPWVSGVASLFSQEFYRSIKGHLNEGGLFVQWMHLYEMETKLVGSVMKALSRHFTDYAIYSPRDESILVLAKNGGTIAELDPRVLAIPGLAKELTRIGIQRMQDFELRWLGNKNVLDSLFMSYAIPANSDYFPVLDSNAAKARFLRASAFELVRLGRTSLPAIEMLSATPRNRGPTSVTASKWLKKVKAASAAAALRDLVIYGRSGELSAAVSTSLRRDMELVRIFVRDCQHTRQWGTWFASFFSVSVAMFPYLSREESKLVWTRFDLPKCRARLNPTQTHWLSLLKAVSERDAATMARSASAILSTVEHYNLAHFEYVLAAGILGRVVLGEGEEARKLWAIHGKQLKGASEPPLLFRLLLAHSRDVDLTHSPKAEILTRNAGTS